MHHLDRGPEPTQLNAVRNRYTPKWVAHYRNGAGAKPSDSKWRDFQETLAIPFHFLCGYCEEARKGDVDHFRPKSRDPELVYEWSNWVYACHDCNGRKGDKWPDEGYVDPCAARNSAKPEAYFDFDLLTAEIIPRDNLQGVRRRRAVKMIEDLDLNSVPHLVNRRTWVEGFKAMVEDRPPSHTVVVAALAKYTAPDQPNCGILRKLASDMGLT